MLKDLTIGFLGAGNMAEALARGLLAAKAALPSQLRAADPSEARRKLFEKDLGVQAGTSNTEVAKAADVLVLAVKPGLVAPVGAEVGALGKKTQLVISIAAGIPLDAIEAGWKGKPLARVMPNTPALVSCGAAAVCYRNAGDKEKEIVREILGAVGLVVEVEKESLLDAVTGLSGSGPAYVFEFIEALADGGVLMGLPRDQALQLAAATVEGAARMVRKTGEHPASLKDKVASPGGTTIAGLAALESRGFRSSAIEAVRAATERSRELAAEAKKK